MAIRFYLTDEYRRKMRGLRPLSEEFFCVLSVYYLGVLSAFAFLGIIKSCSEGLTAEYAEKNARREPEGMHEEDPESPDGNFLKVLSVYYFRVHSAFCIYRDHQSCNQRFNGSD